MKQKVLAIYHSKDFDGICCREIAKKFYATNSNVELTLVGWTHGDPLIDMPEEGEVVVMDLSPDCLKRIGNIEDFNSVIAPRVIWIDHHKTAIDKWPYGIPGFRLDGVAACRLTWQYFFNRSTARTTRTDFYNRAVEEPETVRLLGEYDIWDKRDSYADLLQYGLRAQNPDKMPEIWGLLLGDNRGVADHTLHQVLVRGEGAQQYAQNMDASLVRHNTIKLHWEGLTWLCINTGRFNSLTFKSIDVPESGHDALMGMSMTPNGWTVSLYHAAHRKDLDLSVIAKKHGGGGHKGACGFQVCAANSTLALVLGSEFEILYETPKDLPSGRS